MASIGFGTTKLIKLTKDKKKGMVEFTNQIDKANLLVKNVIVTGDANLCSMLWVHLYKMHRLCIFTITFMSLFPFIT